MKQIIQIFFGRWESDFKCYNKCFLICASNIACQKLYSEFARFIWWSFAVSLWLIYSTIVISCDTFPVVLTNLFYNCYLMWHFSGGVAISFSYNSREMLLFPEETVYIPLQQNLRKNHWQRQFKNYYIYIYIYMQSLFGNRCENSRARCKR